MKPTTFPHAVAYVGGSLITAIAWLAAQNPASFAFLPPRAAAIGAGAVALAGAILTFAHQSGWIGTDSKAPTLTKGLALIPLGLLLAFLHGCATLTKVETALSSPSAQPYLIAAADVAVATAEARGITAAQITGIAQQALAADSGTAATLATIAAAANAEIAKLGLPAGDVAAAQVLEAALTVAIQAQIGSNASVAQAQAAVATVLNAIIAAANPVIVSPVIVSPPTAEEAPGPSLPLADQAPRNTGLALVESPPVVGASVSALTVACLQAFAHISVAVPVAAALTVLGTLGAAYLDL